MMKNNFYFMFLFQALFVLEIFKIFALTFIVMLENGMMRKLRLISLPIVANISRSKDNQIMKVGQLTKYNMRNIFIEKS